MLTGRVCKNIGKYVKFWCCEVNIWDWSESTKHIGRDVEILMLQNLQVGLGGPQPIKSEFAWPDEDRNDNHEQERFQKYGAILGFL